MKWQFTIFFVVFICPIIWAAKKGTPSVDRYLKAKTRNKARAFLKGDTIRDLDTVIATAMKGQKPLAAT